MSFVVLFCLNESFCLLGEKVKVELALVIQNMVPLKFLNNVSEIQYRKSEEQCVLEN